MRGPPFGSSVKASLTGVMSTPRPIILFPRVIVPISPPLAMIFCISSLATSLLPWESTQATSSLLNLTGRPRSAAAVSRASARRATSALSIAMASCGLPFCTISPVTGSSTKAVSRMSFAMALNFSAPLAKCCASERSSCDLKNRSTLEMGPVSNSSCKTSSTPRGLPSDGVSRVPDRPLMLSKWSLKSCLPVMDSEYSESAVISRSCLASRYFAKPFQRLELCFSGSSMT